MDWIDWRRSCQLLRRINAMSLAIMMDLLSCVWRYLNSPVLRQVCDYSCPCPSAPKRMNIQQSFHKDNEVLAVHHQTSSRYTHDVTLYCDSMYQLACNMGTNHDGKGSHSVLSHYMMGLVLGCESPIDFG